MNRREKILLALVVGTLVLGLGLKLFRSQVLDRIVRMDRTIAAKQVEIRNINAQKAVLRGQTKFWDEIAAQTLSTDVSEAHSELLYRLTELAQKHGIPKPSVAVIEARPFKSGLTPLPITIDGTGTLSDVVRFLYALHNQPYIVQTRSVKLVPVKEKNETRIRLTLKGESLALPPHKLAPDATTVMKTPAEKQLAKTRTAFAEASKYQSIAEKHIFERYVKPPTPEPFVDANRKHDPETQPAKHTDPVTPVVQRKFDPARTSTKLTALIGTPDRQEVVLTGTDKKRRVVKIGDDFDGGTLIFVHPEGAVVVYKDEKGKDEKDFYPAGKLMSDMKVLTEDENPEVFSIVSRMETAGREEKAPAPGQGS
jgi:Tfp pilus assembly protein PilO